MKKNNTIKTNFDIFILKFKLCQEDTNQVNQDPTEQTLLRR